MQHRVPLLISIALFSVSSLALAQTYQLTAPSAPVGIYDKIRLVPQTSAPPSYEGTLYLKTGDISPSLCIQSGGTAYWGYLSGVWTQLNQTSPLHQHFVYVPSPPADLKLHIGGALNNSVPLTQAQLADLPKLTLDDFFDTSRTTQDGGILAMGNTQNNLLVCGNLPGPTTFFLWYPRKAALWVNNIDASSDPVDADMGLYSVSFGSTSYASGEASTVSGGMNNSATRISSVIGGGANNSTSGVKAAIAGGFGNIASGSTAFIGGGQSNTASGMVSVVIGGINNLALGSTSAIGGGENNYIEDSYGTILGGQSNAVGAYSSDSFSAIGGGKNNKITGEWGFIGGGQNNLIYGKKSVIAGGQNNKMGFDGASYRESNYSTIIGGQGNNLLGYFSFIGGGNGNVIDATADADWWTYAAITGGNGNAVRGVSGVYSFIGGGNANIALGSSATVMGGQNNTASGNYSFVGGGYGNIALGNSSIVLGGQGNRAEGDFSWAGGTNMKVTGANSFVWGFDADPSDIDVSQSNAFVIFPDGESKVGIGKTSSIYPLEVNGDVQITRSGSSNFTSLQIDNITVTPVGSVLEYNTSDHKMYQDIAETFESQENLSGGDVVVLDPQKTSIIRRSRRPYDPLLIGVVSSEPASTFEGSQLVISPPPFIRGKKPPVALAGRVPVKVSLENGPIAIGDLLTSSSKPGHAMKATDKEKARHAVIGKALEPFTGGPRGKKTGLIEAVIMTR